MPPRAATICGITMNMLNIPMETPIFSGFTELDRMAYGIERILPHVIPINAKAKFRMPSLASLAVVNNRNPAPPARREIM